MLVTVACGTPTEGTTEGASSSSGGSTGGAASTSGDVPTTDPTTTTTGATESGGTSTTEPATTEPPTTGDTSTTGADPSTTDVTATTGEPGTTSTGETGDPLAQCLMMVDPGDMCGECVCTNCTMEFEDCQADMGCTKIFKCAQESGCSGADCVGPCGATINMYGGFMGESAAKAITLGMCVGNMCAMECGG